MFVKVNELNAWIHTFGYDISLLILRALRKKIVLGCIVGFSFLYCVISLLNSHTTILTNTNKNSNYEYDDIVDKEDFNNIQNLNQFTFLKRQHKLKEILNDSLDDKSKISKQNKVNGSKLDSNLVLGDDNVADGLAGIKCRNSVQGKLLIADDRGYVCLRKHVGINGCCAERKEQTKLYSCETCQLNGCCAIYEHCISCCMSPNNRDLLNRLVEEKKSNVFKIFLASITDYFELCLTKCRTSSASVQHENTYRNPKAKYCYSNKIDSNPVIR